MSISGAIVQSKKIKDDRLDIDQIDHYSLSFFIHTRTIQLTVFDERKKRLLLLEEYHLQGQSAVDALEEIHRDHVLISAGFWQSVRVNVHSNQFCIVPSELFSFEHQFDYIKLNSDTDPLVDTYRSVTYDPLDVAYVFAIQKSVVKWFSDKYFNLEVRHSHAGLNFLKFVDKTAGKKEGQRLFIHIGNDEMMLAGLDNDKLAIYNQFPVNEADQLIKYVLLSIKQFGTEGQGTSITLWGAKESIASFKPFLTRYFSNLSIGERPKMKMGPQFGELEPFELVDLLSIYA